MNNNEIMNNEVVEATEEVIENAGLSKGVKIAAGIGLSVVVGVVVYKYVAKPVIANIKAQIEQKKMAALEGNYCCSDGSESEEQSRLSI